MTRHFDCIVIGSGLGGLTAAALCARQGQKVLVLERNDIIGGAATVMSQHGIEIETSLRETDGLTEDDLKLPIFKMLGIDKYIDFTPIGDPYELRSPVLGEPFILPRGMTAALAATQARFPKHARALEKYFSLLQSTRQSLRLTMQNRHEGRPWFWQSPVKLWRLASLANHRHTTVGEVLDRLFGNDEAVKLALTANLYYHTDAPSQILFANYAIMQAAYWNGGGHYVRGGSRTLATCLASVLKEEGGSIEVKRDVKSILLDGNKAIGVGHRAHDGSDPQTDFALVIFGNAAPQVLADMLPPDKHAAFLRPYQSRPLSISLWTISLVFKFPPWKLGARRYSTIVLPSWVTRLNSLGNASRLFGNDPAPGGPLPPYRFVDYSQISSGLNESGGYLGAISGIDRLENWESLSAQGKQQRAEKWMDRIIDNLDLQFPGIKESITHRQMTTAETLHRYLNTPGGAAFGFAPEAGSGSMNERSPKTAIDGLWLASAFTFSGGFTGAIVGGAEAARMAVTAVAKAYDPKDRHMASWARQ